ncbi:FG-GAP-like repeat-containing protein [Nostoc sp. 'Peltigera membranacea cyanobiont' 232]|uniref:FG-GAP-like repeat-containing protein n=1 Tax=Nostoc sp. 'Peltigera membranacea cyanobiont' 232 TaxID=2014531 RepID=UPI000B95653A|nr:FG-GAP-like repeat-containing protein [Nostoc sp. 'Peltigera membranacea cyanobiont' 232]OYE06697.1 hypothetical protein CDG79_00050 [Nostoc sp. 'Peltigera membranacea cyanobiont' 232]
MFDNPELRIDSSLAQLNNASSSLDNNSLNSLQPDGKGFGSQKLLSLAGETLIHAWQNQTNPTLAIVYAAGSIFKSNFAANAHIAFGEAFNVNKAEALGADILSGNYGVLPDVQFLSNTQMNGAFGAYAKSNNTIYLNSAFLTQNSANPTAIGKVLVEESGHFLDVYASPVDSPGDEGEMLADLILGDQLSADQITRIRAEDDSATIVVNGQKLGVEQSSPVPTITISATDANAGETLAGQPTNPGQFTLTRTGSIASALTVNYTMGGTAINGTDYNKLTNSVSFAAGSSTALININPIDDGEFEGNETVILTLATATNYNLGTVKTATVNIADNDKLRSDSSSIAAQGVVSQIVDPKSGLQVQGVGDFNGDGKADILWKDSQGKTAIWLMDGLKILNQAYSQSVDPKSGFQVQGIGDFNGDGKADVLWKDSQGKTAIWLMDGLKIANQAYSQSIDPKSGFEVKGIGDFNGDGKDDVLWRDNQGNNAVWLMDGLKIAKQGFTQFVDPKSGYEIKGVGDFNGDGKADVLWRDQVGNNTIWFMDDGFKVSPERQGTTQFVDPLLGWQVKGVGDFNGDGKADIFWQDNFGQTAIWQMDGLKVASQSWSQAVEPALGWQFSGIGDFNNDGAADILWRNKDGNTDEWLMKGLPKPQETSNSSIEWSTTVFRWKSGLGKPPADFWEGGMSNHNAVGQINLGSNIRSDGKQGIKFDIGNGSLKNGTQLPSDYFVLRSYTTANFDGGEYTFRVKGDDGFQILAKRQDNGQWTWITPEKQWQESYNGFAEYKVKLDAGRYDLHFHYFDVDQGANLDLSWEKVQQSSSGSYDRQAAADYARKWANGRNPAYKDFSNVGGNCANFVSQCLIQGHELPTIHIGADELKNYLVGQHLAREVSSINDIQVGDVIAYSWDGGPSMDHVALYLGNGKVGSNTTDGICDWRMGVGSSVAPNGKCVLLHIIDGDQKDSLTTGSNNSIKYNASVIPSTWSNAASPYIPTLIEAFASQGITSVKALAYAASTICFESSWNPQAENTTDRYAGTSWSGKGLAQITTPGNYSQISKLTGIDFVGHPEYMFDPRNSLIAKAAFYKMTDMISYIERGDYESAAGIYNAGDAGYRSSYTRNVANAVSQWLGVFAA